MQPLCLPNRTRWLVDIIALLVIATAIHGWLIAHTDLPAADGMGYITYAWRLRHEPWRDVLPVSAHHPGYPALVAAWSVPICHLLGGATCQNMVLSAQLANAVPACLLVLPMFWLGQRLFDRRVAWWGTALFQFLPAFARASSDALSEGPFLFAVALALCCAVRGLERRSVLSFALAGFCGGLAYLVRPEGAICVAAAGLLLIALQTAAAYRWQLRRALAAEAALTLTAVSIALPYMATIGGLTLKPTANAVMQFSLGSGTHFQGLIACTFASWWNPAHEAGIRSMGGVAMEFLRAGHVVSVIFLPLGLWWYRDPSRRRPEMLLPLLVAGMQALLVLAVAVRLGYAAQRHMLVILMCTVFWAVAAMTESARMLALRFAFGPGHAVRWGTALVLFACLICLPKTCQRLHSERLGHRAAGRWLADHAGPADLIVDPCSWTAFYAGRLLRDAAPPDSAAGRRAVYVVHDCSKGLHGQVDDVEKVANELLPRGTLVYDWCPPRGSHPRASEVQVYLVAPTAVAALH